jgi:serine/threonine-protein kinase
MERQAQSGVGWSSLTPSESAEVRTSLDRVLASSGFASSARRTQLLRYLVERALCGQGEQITEYGIGLDVFERPTSFDPRLDSIVRTEASRLRQKLREYYANQGQGDSFVIEIPQRSYAPSISVRKPGPVPGKALERAPAPVLRRPLFPAGLAAIGVMVAALVVTAVAWNRSSAAPITSLVILPFQNFSPAGDAEYLADGVTEELTNELAQRRDLRVVSRTSAFAFKGKGVDIREIGRKLNVGAALEGSVSKEGDSVRVTAQLIRTSDGYHLWSHSYEVPYRDVMTVQAQVTQTVEAAVLKHGTPEPAAPVSTTSPEAHDLYLRASYQLSRQTPDSFAKSLELYQGAVEKDPAYVNAYRGIARAEIALIHITAAAPEPAFGRARKALEKALQINPDDAESLGQLAHIDYVYNWDWPRAQREFRLAVERGAQATTHSYYGWSLATRGEFEEAHRHLRIAQDLDPLGAGPRTNQAMAFILEHRYSEAKRILHESIDSRSSVLDGHILLGLVAIYERDCNQAAAHFEWSARQLPSPVANFGLALASACRGQEEQARQFLGRVAAGGGGAAFASPYQLAMGYCYIHDRDAALGYLEKSAEAREGQIFYIKYDPAFDEIRSDPRFIVLEKKVGLE